MGLAAPSANRFGRISPTLAAHVVDEFLHDLRASVEEVKQLEDPLDLAQIRETVTGLIEQFGPNALDQLRAMAGIEGNGTPTEWAMLNSIFDALPRPLLAELLVDFINDLYV